MEDCISSAAQCWQQTACLSVCLEKCFPDMGTLHALQMQLEAVRAQAAQQAAAAEGQAWSERVAAAEAEVAHQLSESARLQEELRAARRGVLWTPKAAEVCFPLFSPWNAMNLGGISLVSSSGILLSSSRVPRTPRLHRWDSHNRQLP